MRRLYDVCDLLLLLNATRTDSGRFEICINLRRTATFHSYFAYPHILIAFLYVVLFGAALFCTGLLCSANGHVMQRNGEEFIILDSHSVLITIKTVSLRLTCRSRSFALEFAFKWTLYKSFPWHITNQMEITNWKFANLNRKNKFQCQTLSTQFDR